MVRTQARSLDTGLRSIAAGQPHHVRTTRRDRLPMALNMRTAGIGNRFCGWPRTATRARLGKLRFLPGRRRRAACRVRAAVRPGLQRARPPPLPRTAGARSYGCYTDRGVFGLPRRNPVPALSGLTACAAERNWPDSDRRDPSKPLHNSIKRNQTSTRWGPNGYQSGTGLGECELVRYHIAMKLRSGSGHRLGRNAAAEGP